MNMQCLALNATPVSMTCYKIERTFAAGHAMCLVGSDGTREEGHFCTTLAPKHVYLHANATVRGLLPRKGESLVRSIGDLIAAASAAASALVTALTKFQELPSSVSKELRCMQVDMLWGKCCTEMAFFTCAIWLRSVCLSGGLATHSQSHCPNTHTLLSQ